jgi:hypothetical protein
LAVPHDSNSSFGEWEVLAQLEQEETRSRVWRRNLGSRLPLQVEGDEHPSRETGDGISMLD